MPLNVADAVAMGMKELPAHFATAHASAFRARGEPYFPGAIILLRAGTFAMPSAKDDRYVLGQEAIVGMAMWGAYEVLRNSPLESGSITVNEEGTLRVPAIKYDWRPTCGVAEFDCWIARAVMLRQLLNNQVTSISGPLALSQSCVIAAIEQVATVLRDRASNLLQRMPGSARGAATALAALVDTNRLDGAVLTNAILQLTIDAARWREASPGSNRVGAWIDPDWSVLAEAAKIGIDKFRDIRDAAGIEVTEKGAKARKRRYSIAEIIRMINAVRQGRFHKAEFIAQRWIALINTP